MHLLSDYTTGFQDFNPAQVAYAAMEFVDSGEVIKTIASRGALPNQVNDHLAFLHVNVGCLSKDQQKQLESHPWGIAAQLLGQLTSKQRKAPLVNTASVSVIAVPDPFELFIELVWVPIPLSTSAFKKQCKRANVKSVGLLMMNIREVRSLSVEDDPVGSVIASTSLH